MPLMHTRFSRWMGPVPQQKPGAAGWLMVIALVAGLLLVLITHPIGTLATIGTLVLIGYFPGRAHTRRMRVMQRERANEDIGTFARAFARHAGPTVDPWAIRAVWDALTPFTECRGERLPLRPSDRFEADLGIDLDDLEDLVPQLVERCERVPGNWKANPYYEKLSTVGNLVYFISAQPLRRSA